MLGQPLDSHLVTLTFFLCICGHTHLGWQKEIPNYQLKYQLVWCVVQPHWTSHCMCDTCVPRNISPDQRRKYLPQKVKWLDLRSNIREISLEPYVELLMRRWTKTSLILQWPEFRRKSVTGYIRRSIIVINQHCSSSRFFLNFIVWSLDLYITVTCLNVLLAD